MAICTDIVGDEDCDDDDTDYDGYDDLFNDVKVAIRLDRTRTHTTYLFEHDTTYHDRTWTSPFYLVRCFFFGG